MCPRLLRRGLPPSIFIPSDRDTWYLILSLSSTREEVGEAALPGSGDTSLGGVGGKPNRCGLEWEEDGPPEEPPPGYRDPPEGCRGVLANGLTVQGL